MVACRAASGTIADRVVDQHPYRVLGRRKVPPAPSPLLVPVIGTGTRRGGPAALPLPLRATKGAAAPTSRRDPVGDRVPPSVDNRGPGAMLPKLALPVDSARPHGYTQACVLAQACLGGSFVRMPPRASGMDGPPQSKNQHAVALGRLGGKKGGAARASSLPPERRSEIARCAARARWDRSAMPQSKEGN